MFLGRKLSYFAPAGGSGKKNSQTQILNSQTQILNSQTQISNSQTQISNLKKFTNPNRFAKNLTNFQNYVIL